MAAMAAMAQLHSKRLLGDVIQLSTELGHSFSQVLTAVAPMQRFLSDARPKKTPKFWTSKL